jgi:phosphate transport system substrate-binding protein
MPIALLGAMSVLATGCANNNTGASTSNSSTTIKRLDGAGSSFVNPMMQEWTSVYQKEKGINVNYQSKGSGAGIAMMSKKLVDFGCSDAPLNEEQLQEAKKNGGEVVHVPLVMGGVVPAYNLSGLSKPIQFSGAVLADIFLGKIKKWNDPALVSLNNDLTLPDLEIAVVHRSDGSGSTYIWVDYLSKVSPDWKKTVGVGTSVNWPCGVGQKGTEGVSAHVQRTPGAIGYVELLYALQNKIPYGAVENAEHEFIQASLQSVTAAANGALTTIPEDLRYSLTNPAGRGAYPISGTVWAVVYIKQPDEKSRALVEFLRWLTHDGQKHVEELHYAKLPPGLVERADKKIERIAAGS